MTFFSWRCAGFARRSAAAMLLLGCSSTDLEPGSERPCASPLLGDACHQPSPPTPEAPEVQLEALPAELAALFCAASAKCCQQSGRSLDAAECGRATEAAHLEEFSSLAALPVRYDAAAAARCLQSRKALYARCDMPTGEETDDPCADVFVGELLEGTVCESDVECARIAGEPAICEPKQRSTSPVCHARAAVGAECIGSTCQTGLYCDLFSASCQPRKESGHCEIVTACAASAACSPQSQCEPRKAVGEACQLALQCESNWCSGGFCEKPLGSAEACDG